MVLDRHRGVLDPILNPWTHVLRNVDPNVLTWLSFPFAVAAGVFFYFADPTVAPQRWYLLAAAFCVMINGILDLLDGRVARIANKQTPLGDFLDHTLDRFADVAILTGLSLSPYVNEFGIRSASRIGLVAIVVVILSSYIGTQAQAVGHGRIYGGMLARADRMVLLMGLPILDAILADQGITLHFLSFLPGTQYTLGIFLYYVAIAGTVTMLERFVRVLVFLRRKQSTGDAAQPRHR